MKDGKETKSSNGATALPPRGLPRMMLAFVVRRCTVELGHPPTAAELAAWANGDGQGPHLFGRPIDEQQAAIILKHQSRLVSAQSARNDEVYVEIDELARMLPANVVRLDAARARRGEAAKRRP